MAGEQGNLSTLSRVPTRVRREACEINYRTAPCAKRHREGATVNRPSDPGEPLVPRRARLLCGLAACVLLVSGCSGGSPGAQSSDPTPRTSASTPAVSADPLIRGLDVCSLLSADQVQPGSRTDRGPDQPLADPHRGVRRTGGPVRLRRLVRLLHVPGQRRPCSGDPAGPRPAPGPVRGRHRRRGPDRRLLEPHDGVLPQGLHARAGAGQRPRGRCRPRSAGSGGGHRGRPSRPGRPSRDGRPDHGSLRRGRHGGRPRRAG